MEEKFKVTSFKNRFSSLVDESEKTTIDLAKELHVSNQTISAWKTGTRSPKEPTIIAIANHFGVTVQWLMGFNVEKWDTRAVLEKAFRDYSTEGMQQPHTPEARSLALGVDKMPKEQREKVMNMVKAVFAEYFDEGK